MRLKLAAAALVLGTGIGVALAQGIPTLWDTTPTGQEAVNVTAYSPGAQIVSVPVASIRDARGYTKLVPTTGNTITVGGAVGCSPVSATAGNCVSVLQLRPAAGLAALTILTPLFPVDGQVMQIFSTAAVTTLTMTAQSGQTLNNPLTALTANQGGAWIYSASTTTWDRFQ
jgi:hypothetical protein